MTRRFKRRETEIMSFQTYTRPRRAAVSPAVRLSGGPVTRAIRALRPNEMPSWEIREAEMRRQEAADLRALRRRVAKAVAEGIDFLDATGGDPDLEDGADDEPSLGSLGGTGQGRMLFGFGCKAERWAGGSDDDREEDAGDMAEAVNEGGDAFEVGY